MAKFKMYRVDNASAEESNANNESNYGASVSLQRYRTKA